MGQEQTVHAFQAGELGFCLLFIDSHSLRGHWVLGFYTLDTVQNSGVLETCT